jgi:aspartyl-tRNA(Asn)/glutamyl-tRNA(Gln) amidotransferase subunit C
MNITREQVLHMAELAQLEPDAASVELFARQFGDILRHMDVLNAVDTGGAEPLYQPIYHGGDAARPDLARPSRDRGEILSAAPEQDGRYFIVPRIVG